MSYGGSVLIELSNLSYSASPVVVYSKMVGDLFLPDFTFGSKFLIIFSLLERVECVCSLSVSSAKVWLEVVPREWKDMSLFGKYLALLFAL